MYPYLLVLVIANKNIHSFIEPKYRDLTVKLGWDFQLELHNMPPLCSGDILHTGYRPLICFVSNSRGNILKLTFEIFRSENDLYYGHSYIARHDERIQFNGLTNDRCAADRELEIRETLVRTQKVGFVSAKAVWNMLMSSNRYIRMSLVLQEISYGI